MKIDIHISNSGSGFYGIHGQTAKGRRWIAKHVQDAYCGEAWSDDRNYAWDIAQGAIAAGLTVD